MDADTTESRQRGRGRPATGRSTVLVRVPVELETAVKRWTADYRRAREQAQRGLSHDRDHL